MEQKRSGGISNGFIIGFLLGIVVTLLFTTKRGRSIVRLLTEKGTEKIDSWKDILEATEEEFFEDEGLIDDEPIVAEEVPAKPSEPTETKAEKHVSTTREKSKEPVKKPFRRFFRQPK